MQIQKLKFGAVRDLHKASQPASGRGRIERRSAKNMPLPKGKTFTNKRTITGLGKEEHAGMKMAHLTTVKLFQGEMKTNWN